MMLAVVFGIVLVVTGIPGSSDAQFFKRVDTSNWNKLTSSGTSVASVPQGYDRTNISNSDHFATSETSGSSDVQGFQHIDTSKWDHLTSSGSFVASVTQGFNASNTNASNSDYFTLETFGSSDATLPQSFERTTTSEWDHFIDSGILKIVMFSFPCEPPKILPNDGQIDCSFNKYKMTCNHTCANGYTHDNGLSREMTCLKHEKIWKPEYRPCTPVNNCSLALEHVGSYACARSDLFGTILCHITCVTEWFTFPEMKVITKDYILECNDNGEWNAELPPCVKPKGK